MHEVGSLAHSWQLESHGVQVSPPVRYEPEGQALMHCRSAVEKMEKSEILAE